MFNKQSLQVVSLLLDVVAFSLPGGRSSSSTIVLFMMLSKPANARRSNEYDRSRYCYWSVSSALRAFVLIDEETISIDDNKWQVQAQPRGSRRLFLSKNGHVSACVVRSFPRHSFDARSRLAEAEQTRKGCYLQRDVSLYLGLIDRSSPEILHNDT